ncbi:MULTISPECIES: YARHG domain-containing protein [unclassified Clostridioides]|uniref:YARHG domain-containing protein n=1 Tax=unclassified Clostridioides TaxID=2635829 RepID=UPI001D12C6DF|nr:YARHG domain-containing protein [Clostridioides sp. ZZV14-6150]MCC0660366.1 YARHG domain-containing protein [Clostridioides sp. ZZV14-6154]MCC0720833.1 YARHG domain-containing protein [Clostridioides sp. ZZV14-6104]MCC0741358.1 YARHG domain-containing protein [Clostridioides sp. ZZV14-6044]MCC0749539.1 YARHG domain-containing protein [Clostridioides sp. ZZV13-5731]
MFKKGLFIVLSLALICTGCSSKNGSKGKQADRDNSLILLKNDENNSDDMTDVYIKTEGKDEEKIASDVPTYTKKDYINGEQSILIQDKENNLYKYNLKKEKEKIASDLSSDEINSYEFMPSSNTIAYISSEKSLYVKYDGKDKEKIANDVVLYRMSTDGKFIYYMNTDEELYLYKEDGNKEKISTDIQSFDIVNNKGDVIFINNDDNLYLKSTDKNDKVKISSDVSNLWGVKSNDEEIMYISEYNYKDLKGELYLYKNNVSEKIASDIRSYKYRDNKFYFINSDDELYEKEIGKEESNKIKSDINYVSFIKDGIVFTNSDGDIYIKKNNKEDEKIGNDMKENSNVSIINDEELLYIKSSGELFLDKDKIASDVIGYSFNSENIAYSTKNKEIHFYNLKTKKDNIEINNVGKYSEVYLGNKLIYSKNLEPKDLNGFWKADEYNIFEFEEPNKIKLYSKSEEESNYTVKYEEESSDSNSIVLKGKDTLSKEKFTITKFNSNEISLQANNVSGTLNKISKEEAEKFIKSINNKENSENTDKKSNKSDSGSSSNTKNKEVSYDDDYIIYDSDSRVLTKDELGLYSKEELAYIRNEIFARYGYVFKEEPYKSYFSNKSWYQPDYSIGADTDILNSVEKQNVSLIKEMEN